MFTLRIVPDDDPQDPQDPPRRPTLTPQRAFHVLQRMTRTLMPLVEAAGEAACGRGDPGSTEDLVRYLVASTNELVAMGEGPAHSPMEDEMIRIQAHFAAMTAAALVVHFWPIQGLDPDLALEDMEYGAAVHMLAMDLRARFRSGGLPAFVEKCGAASGDTSDDDRGRP